MSFAIRDVTASDRELLLELIHELARFDRRAHEVEADVESLREALFGPRRVAGALLAHTGAEPAGYAIYFFTFSSFVGRAGLWLDDLYVRPAFRRQGLGRSLIQAVARIAAERRCGRLEWSALRWNKPALEFYEGLGARLMDDWGLLRMNAEGIRRLAMLPAS